MFAGLARSPLLVIVLVASACVVAPSRPQLLRGDRATLDGDVVVDRSTGHVVLLQAEAQRTCREERRYPDGHLQVMAVPCRIDWKSVRLTSPWGRTFPATEISDGRVGFAVDWKSTAIDAIDSDRPEVLTRAWRFSSPDVERTREWTPDRATQQVMLELVGEATETEVDAGEANAPPPQLVVAEARFDGELRNDTANQLTVTLTNRGTAAGYRVRLVTRSNIPALHGLRLTFGRLRPGESRTRRARVVLPRDNPEDEAVVVLGFEEAHGNVPPQTSVRARVLPAIDPAVLRVECHPEGLQGSPPRVDAGATLRLGCDVRNDGSAAHGVRLHVGYPGRKGGVEPPAFDLDAKSTNHVTVGVGVPREAAIDSQLVLEITVVDDLGARASTTVQLAIATPKLCPDGRITREQFLEKRTALRKKHDAGLISDADYKHYEDELIGCLTL
jgi:hypothetical protein